MFDDLLTKNLTGAWDFLVGLLPWWVPYVGYGVAAIAVLWVLSMVKNVFGWPGVILAGLALVAIASGLFGFAKGVEWANARIPAAREAVKARPRKTIFGRTK